MQAILLHKFIAKLDITKQSFTTERDPATSTAKIPRQNTSQIV